MIVSCFKSEGEIQAPFAGVFLQYIAARADRPNGQAEAPHHLQGEAKGFFHHKKFAAEIPRQYSFGQVALAEPEDQFPVATRRKVNDRGCMGTRNRMSVCEPVGQHADARAGTILTGGAEHHFHFYFPDQGRAHEQHGRCFGILS